MKKISFLMAALFCLAACDKQEIVPLNPSDDGQEDKYEVVLNTVVTKSGITEVSLQMGDVEEYTLVATLLKNGSPVSGATFSWNDPETGGYYSGYTQNNTANHDITAIKEGSGSTLNVTGYEGGKARATSQDIEVNVKAAQSGPSQPYPIRYVGKIETSSNNGAWLDGNSADSNNWSSDNVFPSVAYPDGSEVKITVSGTVYMSDGTSFAVKQSQGIVSTSVAGVCSASFTVSNMIADDVVTIEIGYGDTVIFTWNVIAHWY